MREDQYDVVVVGSGMSGLSAATVLCKHGMKVLVLEQHYRAGGFMHRFYRKGGLAFDVGFHYVGSVGRNQPLGAYLNYMGVYDRLNFIALNPEGYDRLRFPDFEYKVPSGVDRLRDALTKVAPTETSAIDQYLRDLNHIVDGFGYYRMRPEQNFAHVDKWFGTPLEPYVKNLTQNTNLRLALMGQSPLYGVAPKEAPMALHALVTDSFTQGAFTIEGGGDSLAQTMVDRIRELGGDVKLKRRVTKIDVDDSFVARGVETERGEYFECSHVISCAHPKLTYDLLPKNALRKAYRKRVTAMKEGCSTLSLFMTTDADLDHRSDHNVYHYKDRDLNAAYDTSCEGYNFAFVSVPSAREGKTKKGLHQVIALGLMGYEKTKAWEASKSGERGVDYETLKKKESESLLETVYEAMPELRGRILSMESATPLTNRDYCQSPGGAAYGIHHSVEQSGRYGLRPRTKIKNVILCGQSVLSPGVCGVTISGIYACGLLLGGDVVIENIRKELGLVAA